MGMTIMIAFCKTGEVLPARFDSPGLTASSQHCDDCAPRGSAAYLVIQPLHHQPLPLRNLPFNCTD